MAEKKNMSQYEDALRRRIDAYNKSANIINALVRDVKPVLQEFLTKGKQVIKADGTATVRFRKAIDPILEKYRVDNVQVFLGMSHFSGVDVTVVVSYEDIRYTERLSRTIHLVDVDNDTRGLAGLAPFKEIEPVEPESFIMRLRNLNRFAVEIKKTFEKLEEGLGAERYYFDEFKTVLSINKGRMVYYDN